MVTAYSELRSAPLISEDKTSLKTPLNCDSTGKETLKYAQLTDFLWEKWIALQHHLKTGRRRIGASAEEKDRTEKRGTRAACSQAVEKLCF